MPSENNVKKRPAEEEPELAAVRAFVEHAFPLRVTRVSPDKLANGVAEMSVRWVQSGHNVPQVSNALKTQLAMDIPPEKILDILFAWEEVHKSRYLPETRKFMPLRQAGQWVTQVIGLRIRKEVVHKGPAVQNRGTGKGVG